MKKSSKFISLLSLVTFLPVVAFAAGPCDGVNGLGGVICTIKDLLGQFLPVLVSFGVIYFIWGMVQYFIADGEEAKKTGKDRIIYGIIGLAVITSIWGLVDIIVKTFNLSSSAPGGLNVNGSSASCDLGSNPKFQNLLGYVTCIINSSIIPFMFVIAVVVFIWGVLQFFIINADEEAKRAQGKQFMMWGIIALTVMLSVWGLVSILGVTFGVDSKVLPHVTPP